MRQTWGIIGSQSAPAGVATTWSPVDKAAQITLSAANLAAEANASANVSARGTIGRTGLKHFEATMTSVAIAYPGIGLANAVANIGTYIGANNNGICLFGDGSVWRGGVSIGNVGWTYTTGHIIAVEYDEPNQDVYFERSSGGARSGPYDMSIITGLLFPAMSVTTTGNKLTANFGASAFSLPVTGGYSAWG